MDSIRALQITNALRFFAVFLVNVLLAKSGLPLAAINAYETLLFWGYTLSFFWVNGFSEAILSLYRNAASNRQQMLRQALGAFAAFSLLSALALLLGKPFFFNGDGIAGASYFWFVGYWLLHLMSLPAELFFLLRNDQRALLGFAAFSFVGHVMAIGLSVLWAQSMEMAIGCLFLFAALRLVLLLAYAFFGKGRVGMVVGAALPTGGKAAMAFWGMALPFSLRALLGGMDQVVDGSIIGWSFATGALAVYRYGARELPPNLFLTASLRTAILPELAADTGRALQKLKRETLRLMHWLFPLSIALMLCSHSLFPWVFSPAFQESGLIFNIFLLLLVPRLLSPTAVLTAKGEARALALIAAAEIAINVMFSLLLGKLFGLAGIAYATVIAYSFEKIAATMLLKNKYGILLRDCVDVGWLLAYAALLVAAHVAAVCLAS